LHVAGQRAAGEKVAGQHVECRAVWPHDGEVGLLCQEEARAD